jgi:hypothetical protein
MATLLCLHHLLWRWATALFPIFPNSLYDIIYPQKHPGSLQRIQLFHTKKRAGIWRRYLNGCFESLDLMKMSAMNINKKNIIYLDARRLIQAIGFHIHDLACLSVDSPGVFAVRVFGLTKSALNGKAKKK